MMDQGKGLKEGMISSVDGLKNVPVGTSDMISLAILPFMQGYPTIIRAPWK